MFIIMDSSLSNISINSKLYYKEAYRGGTGILLGTIGYWRFARLLNVGCPWILLLPFHRTAYIGLLGNVACKESGKISSLDLSLWSTVLEFSVVVGCGLYYMYRYKFLGIALIYLFVIYNILLWYVHFSLFKLYSKHPLLVSLIWFVPGVVLWQTYVANKRINIYCAEVIEQ